MDLKSLSQLRVSDGGDPALAPNEILTAIFRVTPGYTPPEVAVRSRVDAEMFTGSFAAKHLDGLKADKNIVSLALNRRLARID